MEALLKVTSGRGVLDVFFCFFLVFFFDFVFLLGYFFDFFGIFGYFLGFFWVCFEHVWVLFCFFGIF